MMSEASERRGFDGLPERVSGLRARHGSPFHGWASGGLLLGLLCALLAPIESRADAQDLDRAALDVVFVLDNSGSMRQNDPEFLTRRAVVNFANALGADGARSGRIGIVLFDGRARLVQPLTPIEAGDASARLRVPLSTLDFSGQQTNGPSGIERALYELRENGRADAHKAIVFLTDGKIDTGSRASDLEASRWLREDLAGQSLAEGIRIFGIAFTDAADYQLMQALALKTNASYYRAFEAGELEDVIGEVLARVAEPVEETVARVEDRPAPSPPATDAPLPEVAAATAGSSVDDERFEGIGWLPVALLLVAGSLWWRYRSRVTASGIPAALSPFIDVDPKTPVAQLIDHSGHLGPPGEVHALGQGRTRIGRDPHNDIVLDNDAVSSEHAIIDVRRGRYYLEDRRSTNGTRLGDERLTPGEPVQLKGGDHIRFGEIDLMFVLAGYVPGGATVFLNPSTTSLPLDIERSVLPDANEIETGAEFEARDEAAGNLDETPSSDTKLSPKDRPSISLLPDPPPEADAEPEPAVSADAGVVSRPPVETLRPEPDAYRSVLDYHLARVEELSTALAGFVARGFDDEMRGALAVAAAELVATAKRSGGIEQKAYTAAGIRYLICAVPDALEGARAQFGRAYGGFTRLLTSALQDESFLRERCEILAVLTFGRGAGGESEPWVSLSIVPEEGQEPQIDLLSYEFLTEEERHEIEPDAAADSNRSSHG